MNQINRRSSMYSPERSQKDSYYRSRDRESYSPHFDKKSNKYDDLYTYLSREAAECIAL